MGQVRPSITAILERTKQSRAHQRSKRACGCRCAHAKQALHLFFAEAKPWHLGELVSQASEQRNNGHAGTKARSGPCAGADAWRRFRRRIGNSHRIELAIATWPPPAQAASSPFVLKQLLQIAMAQRDGNSDSGQIHRVPPLT